MILPNPPRATATTANKEKLTQLADILIEKEVIFKDDLENIFGKRPFDKEVTTTPENTDEKTISE